MKTKQVSQKKNSKARKANVKAAVPTKTPGVRGGRRRRED